MRDEKSDQVIELPDIFAEMAVYSNYPDVKDNALEAVETIREADKSNRGRFYQENSEEVQQLVMFFLWNSLLIEEGLVTLTETHLIGTGNMTPQLKEYLRGNNFTYEHHRELLHKAEIIGDGLNGEIKRIRRVRNDVVHNPKRLVAFDVEVLDIPNLDSEIERADDTLKKLFDV